MILALINNNTLSKELMLFTISLLADITSKIYKSLHSNWNNILKTFDNFKYNVIALNSLSFILKKNIRC